MTLDTSTAPALGRRHSHVRETLLAQIRAGAYAPGAKLPSEHTLCETFGVSRITVRQALADLERQGAIDRMHGRGTFVRRPKAYQMVTKLQGFSAAMAPLGHQVHNRLHGFHYIPASAGLAAHLQLNEGDEVAEIERVRMLDGSPVSFERTYVAAPLGRQLAAADLVTRDLFGILEEDLGHALGRAHVAIEATAANAMFADILGVALGMPLLKVERQVFDTSGAPLVYEHLCFRTDSFQYRLQLDRLS
jgi:GntR family transcriptional regulator